MTAYKNISRNSGIRNYFIRKTDMIITYYYTGLYSSYEYLLIDIGITHFNNMKKLAEEGQGLNTYINQNREDIYDKGKKLHQIYID